ncbi:hypothetical protein BASA81_012815 [Batrachochytrium salamandrivorans]|nr:hypothetical protein BASA81_012815 [Batrachochytrium salamandrivorans]
MANHEQDEEIKSPSPEAGENQEEADAEVEELKRRLLELEQEEQQTLENEQQQQQQQHSTTQQQQQAGGLPPAAVDENSIHVGNLPERTTPDDLQAHFKTCGDVKRITIICDKWTGRPKGFAYVEFLEPTAVELALNFNETMINGNTITVTAKRQNVPAFILRGRGGGYRGGPPRGGGGYRGGRGGGGYRGGPPRGGGYRGNYTRGYAPY